MYVNRSIGRVPMDVRVELTMSGSNLLSQLRAIVETVGVPGGNTTVWLEDRLRRHDHGEIMIFTARISTMLVGFMMLEQSTMTASYSWVVPRFRNKGLGERFYSFACINLGAPTPCFMFPLDMRDEYAAALRNLAIEPASDPRFCAIHPTSAVKAA